MCLTCLHPCWWFILEVTIILSAHTLMHWVTCDKLHSFYSQNNHYMIWIGGRNDVNTFAQSVYLISSLGKLSHTELLPDLLRLVFLGVARSHLLDNSNQDKRIKLQQMKLNRINAILHQYIYFHWCLGLILPSVPTIYYDNDLYLVSEAFLSTNNWPSEEDLIISKTDYVRWEATSITFTFEICNCAQLFSILAKTYLLVTSIQKIQKSRSKSPTCFSKKYWKSGRKLILNSN